jgi:hypothetical protein
LLAAAFDNGIFHFLFHSWSSLRRTRCAHHFADFRHAAGKPGYKRPPQRTAAGAEEDNIIPVGYGDVNGWR